MNDARQVFTATLRRHREQLGIPLSAIAESTKISASLLDALERSDLSRWPRGIFRRAFFREYVTAIGLSAESLVADFARLFPDEPGGAIADDSPSELRLVLAAAETTPVTALRRVAVAAAELAAIASVGLVAAWLLHANLWSASGIVALVYYPVSNLCVDRKPAWRGMRALINSQLPTPNFQAQRQAQTDRDEESFGSWTLEVGR